MRILISPLRVLQFQLVYLDFYSILIFFFVHCVEKVQMYSSTQVSRCLSMAPVLFSLNLVIVARLKSPANLSDTSAN